MKIGISIKLDVTKLDKARFYVGEKGTYADLTAFIDTDVQGQYGDNGTISQSATKEEREAGQRMPIAGNCKVFYKADSQPQQAPPPPPAYPQKPDYDQGDPVGNSVPF